MHLLLQPERVLRRAGENFIWIRRNPLRSPDSAKEKQGNASLFAWFYLVFLAFHCRELARRVVVPGPPPLAVLDWLHHPYGLRRRWGRQFNVRAACFDILEELARALFPGE